MQIGFNARILFGAEDRGAALTRILAARKEFCTAAETGWRYYGNENDILNAGSVRERVDKAYEQAVQNPLRNADNRISHPFHQLLVDQKISYLFGKLVLLRSSKEKKEYNDILRRLSERLHIQLKKLGVDAANSGTAWLHMFITPDGEFDFVRIPSAQVIPLYGSSVKRPLEGVIRVYETQEMTDGKLCTRKRAEVWTALDVTRYTERKGRFSPDPATGTDPNPAPHFTRDKKPGSFGAVPWAEFRNNELCLSDLKKVKSFIDAYDKTVSLYVNDIEDMQELIFVLINYGGQDLGEFLSDLKKYKAININKGDGGDSGGVETLKVDIPVDARIKLLEILKKNIWSIGQGIDPELVPSNPSGAALKHLYGALELKASLMETEFKEGLQAVLKVFKTWLKLSTGDDYFKDSEDIIFTRSMIANDEELIRMGAESKGLISDRTIAANHPWVDDVDEEIKQLAEQREAEAKRMADAYSYPGEKTEPGGEK